MLEEERKYEVDDRFSLPDLSDCVPVGGRVLSHDPLTLRATYYDTADYRLARAGVSLRYRKGDAPDKVWTAKLPSDSPGTRHEICRAGHRTVIPADLVSLLTAYHRGSALQPAAAFQEDGMQIPKLKQTGPNTQRGLCHSIGNGPFHRMAQIIQFQLQAVEPFHLAAAP